MTNWVTFYIKVFAVEFTDMAKHAKRLVTKNGMEDVVDVMQCSVEELQLDGKVRTQAPPGTPPSFVRNLTC